MHVFYSTDINNNRLVLSREESTHALKVLRMQPGEEALVLDGKGNRYLSRFEDVRQKQCFFSVIETSHVAPRSVFLTMAVAPTKQMDRFEWFLEKATEIGVERIVPVICQHSERKVVKLERCQKILIAAMKQSRTAYLPELEAPLSLKEYLELSPSPQAVSYIAHCHKEATPHLFASPTAAQVQVLIGPEGDFSLEEVQQAQQSGWKEISLGLNRLRTETAAIVAVHSVALQQI